MCVLKTLWDSLHHRLDLALTYDNASGAWEIRAFGKSITHERYTISGHASSLTQGWATPVVGRLAEWGLGFAYHFGG